MASLYAVSVEAQNDLFEIWRRIAEDSISLADRIDAEFQELFASLVLLGHKKRAWVAARSWVYPEEV
jgi:hypothetical protein